MNEIIKMIDPVRARQERKAQTRLLMEENSRTKFDRKNLKTNIRLDRIEGQEFVRRTTPEIKTLDLISKRQKMLSQLESETDLELISLRRRLVTAEKLVVTRTRERDSANRAHKRKTEAFKSSRESLHKIIAEREVQISLLLKRLERFERRFKLAEAQEIRIGDHPMCKLPQV